MIPKTVDKYIKNSESWAKPILIEIRNAIKKAVPDVKESISYKMPYYSLNGRLAYMGAFKYHCSFFWISADDKKKFSKELSTQIVVGSTLQIPKGSKVPVGLIKKIVKERLKVNVVKK